MKRLSLVLVCVALFAGCGDDPEPAKNDDKTPETTPLPEHEPGPKTFEAIADAYCKLDLVCRPERYESREECMDEAIDDVNEMRLYDKGCGDAIAEVYACLAALDGCEEFDAFNGEELDAGHPCYEADVAADLACELKTMATEEELEIAQAYCDFERSCDEGEFGTFDVPAEICLDELLEDFIYSRAHMPLCHESELDLYRCLGALNSCDELDHYYDGGEDYPCMSEDEASALRCE